MTAPDLLTPWRYYVGADYALPALRAEAAAQLAGCDAIAAQTDELQRLHADATNAHAELRQHAGAQLAVGVVTGKGKPTAADLAKRLTQHRDELPQLELQLQVTRDAHQTVRAALRGLVTANVDHLLRWVAQHREAVGLTVCGNVMPTPVKLMHALLDVPLDPRWDEQLQVPSTTTSTPVTSSRQLPLEWAATDPQQVRASLAWVWQQLAAGNMRRVNVPARHYPNTGRRAGTPRVAVRLTQPVDVLPVVPVVRDRHKP
jgi:hypothetical protein